jgi:hypothetical protein
VRPSCAIVFSTTVTPDLSTGYLLCSPFGGMPVESSVMRLGKFRLADCGGAVRHCNLLTVSFS